MSPREIDRPRGVNKPNEFQESQDTYVSLSSWLGRQDVPETDIQSLEEQIRKAQEADSGRSLALGVAVLCTGKYSNVWIHVVCKTNNDQGRHATVAPIRGAIDHDITFNLRPRVSLHIDDLPRPTGESAESLLRRACEEDGSEFLGLVSRSPGRPRFLGGLRDRIFRT